MVAVEKVVKQLGFFYGIRQFPRFQGRKRNPIFRTMYRDRVRVSANL